MWIQSLQGASAFSTVTSQRWKWQWARGRGYRCRWGIQLFKAELERHSWLHLICVLICHSPERQKTIKCVHPQSVTSQVSISHVITPATLLNITGVTPSFSVGDTFLSWLTYYTKRTQTQLSQGVKEREAQLEAWLTFDPWDSHTDLITHTHMCTDTGFVMTLIPESSIVRWVLAFCVNISGRKKNVVSSQPNKTNLSYDDKHALPY